MLLFTGSVIATILDFWMMLLPLPIAWDVDLPMKARIGILGMFLLGLLICVCVVLKSICIHTLLHTHDESWVARPIWILSALELDVRILFDLPCYNSKLASGFSQRGSVNQAGL